MALLVDTRELKPGLIIFRRADVKHRNWYCRVKLPRMERMSGYGQRPSVPRSVHDGRV